MFARKKHHASQIKHKGESSPQATSPTSNVCKIKTNTNIQVLTEGPQGHRVFDAKNPNTYQALSLKHMYCCFSSICRVY
jgi:hypothetical protein